MAEPARVDTPADPAAYIGRSANSQGEVQLLRDHLLAAAARARDLGEPIGLGELGYWAGLLHDLGKYEERFQRRIRGEKVSCPHSPHGACVALSSNSLEVAFAILAHHTALRDPQALRSTRDDRPPYDSTGPTYGERAMRALALARAEIPALTTLPPPTARGVRPEDLDAFELRTRLVLSLLADADRLDAERHASPEISALRSRAWPSLGELAGRVDRRLNELASQAEASAEVRAVRSEVKQAVEAAATLPPGMATLTVPTGGGKTLASLLYALRHAERWGLRRVIIVVPFLAIIEQNVAAIRAALNESDDTGAPLVLEHHSNVIDEPHHGVESGEGQDGRALWRRLAAENWDAPVIVTTAVQFFESLFSSRPGRVRKLHRVARSVVAFDEVQTFPPQLLQPVLRMLDQLVDEHQTSLLFCTATQPALESRSGDGRRWPAGRLREVMPDPAALFDRMRRVTVEWPTSNDRASWADIALRVGSAQQSLTIVNTKRHARELFETLRAALPSHSVFHLSSRLCPAHRRAVLDSVREQLAAGRPCAVVSTQLVEAGVDIDFPLVLRALAPFDAIAQAAGRCNRRGLLRSRDGAPTAGRLVVFNPADGALPNGLYCTATDHTLTLLRTLASEGRVADIDDPALFTRYFDLLYGLADLDQPKIAEKRRRLEFERVDESFRIIDDDTVPVVAPYGRGAGIIDRLRRVTDDARALARRAQPYTVNLYRREFDTALRNGAIEPLGEEGPYAARPGNYDNVLGFVDRADPADYIV